MRKRGWQWSPAGSNHHPVFRERQLCTGGTGALGLSPKSDWYNAKHQKISKDLSNRASNVSFD